MSLVGAQNYTGYWQNFSAELTGAGQQASDDLINTLNTVLARGANALVPMQKAEWINMLQKNDQSYIGPMTNIGTSSAGYYNVMVFPAIEAYDPIESRSQLIGLPLYSEEMKTAAGQGLFQDRRGYEVVPAKLNDVKVKFTEKVEDLKPKLTLEMSITDPRLCASFSMKANAKRADISLWLGDTHNDNDMVPNDRSWRYLMDKKGITASAVVQGRTVEACRGGVIGNTIAIPVVANQAFFLPINNWNAANPTKCANVYTSGVSGPGFAGNLFANVQPNWTATETVTLSGGVDGPGDYVAERYCSGVTLDLATSQGKPKNTVSKINYSASINGVLYNMGDIFSGCRLRLDSFAYQHVYENDKRLS